VDQISRFCLNLPNIAILDIEKLHLPMIFSTLFADNSVGVKYGADSRISVEVFG
jgi:hypothetical protein